MKKLVASCLMLGILSPVHARQKATNNPPSLTVALTLEPSTESPVFYVQCDKTGTDRQHKQAKNKELASPYTCSFRLKSTGTHILSISQLCEASLPIAIAGANYYQKVEIKQGTNLVEACLMQATVELVWNQDEAFPYFFPGNSNVIVGKLESIPAPQDNIFSSDENSDTAETIPPATSPCIATKHPEKNNTYTAVTEYLQPNDYILTIYERIPVGNRQIELIRTQKAIRLEKGKTHYSIVL